MTPKPDRLMSQGTPEHEFGHAAWCFAVSFVIIFRHAPGGLEVIAIAAADRDTGASVSVNACAFMESNPGNRLRWTAADRGVDWSGGRMAGFPEQQTGRVCG